MAYVELAKIVHMGLCRRTNRITSTLITFSPRAAAETGQLLTSRLKELSPRRHVPLAKRRLAEHSPVRQADLDNISAFVHIDGSVTAIDTGFHPRRDHILFKHGFER